MPAREEIEEYLNHVVDRFDLRRDIQLGTRVTAATFDEARRAVARRDRRRRAVLRAVLRDGDRLPVGADDARRAGARLVRGSRPPDQPVAPGRRRLHRPPRRADRHRLVGRAGHAGDRARGRAPLRVPAHRDVLVPRVPRHDRPGAAGELQGEPRRLPAPPARRRSRASPASAARSAPRSPRSARSSRRPGRSSSRCSTSWASGRARAWGDVFVDLEANEAGAELFREMIRRTVDDPEVAEALSPRGYPIGCKRLVFGVDYYEAFNRDNVTLVDLREGAIESITPTGIQTAQGDYERRRHHLRHRLRRHDRRAEPHRHPRSRRRSCSATCGPTAPARCSGCSRSGSPTCSRSPVRGARRCSPTWSSASSSTWSGSATASPTCATTATARSSPRSRRRTSGSSTSTRSRRGRCSPPPAATRGTWARTSPASRACSCRTSAGCPPTSSAPTRWRAAGYEGFTLA